MFQYRDLEELEPIREEGTWREEMRKLAAEVHELTNKLAEVQMNKKRNK